MVILIIAFLTANAFLGEYIKWGAGGNTVKFFAREDKERTRLNEEQEAKKAARGRREELLG